ncbi:GSCFA domain-containing protein [Flavobacterium gelidilacus]|uniref:GSCFA domain-containing protein n=1 Tax=Flavobacterium gelidilacus TaxID=206041 RepID=UPI00041F9A32|nr:GSCFA domain-containing protein [Flavobacterium gelidilacus]
MQFTTKIPIETSKNPITYESKILALGSCFAENMSEKFQYFKFQITTNPFGIIFNPVSIEKLINRVVNKIEFTEKDIFFHNDLWHCYEVHSELSNPNKEEFLKLLNFSIFQSFNLLIQTTHLTITYGTSWVYRNIESNEIVANCHKVPQKQFKKELLSTETIEKSIQNSIDLIQKANPTCQFIFTISPVRHIKDGFVENTLSKSHLISALHSTQNLKSITYFPSYEIMMDELRDYRFYASDMLHPNQVAIDYIWERFSENYISDESQKVMEDVDSIQKSLLHRSFNPNSESHQKFLANLNKKINTLTSNYSQIEF